MKTPEEIREEALRVFPIESYTYPLSKYVQKDINETNRVDFIKWYQIIYQSSIEQEIEKRVEERMKEYKEGLEKSIEGYRLTFKEDREEDPDPKRDREFEAYDNAMDLFIELLSKE